MSQLNEYNARVFHLPIEALRSLSQLTPSRSHFALVRAWVALGLLAFAMRKLVPGNYFPYLYVPAVFLIASRYGVLLQLIHEGAHGLLSKNKKTNHFLVTWFCSSPIGISVDGYFKGHLRHHAGTNTPFDPKSDVEKYKFVDFRSPKLYLLFLKDLIGFTAFQVFFEYRDYEESKNEPKVSLLSKLYVLFRMAVCQLVILTCLFQWDIRDYFLLWLIPAISPHMFLMRIRGIAEHGLANQLHIQVDSAWQGNYLTRSFLTPANRYKFPVFTWIEKSLIGTLNANFHHEHHLFPTVPYYNLPELHKCISSTVQKMNHETYAKGYFAAALKTLFTPIPVQKTELQLQSM